MILLNPGERNWYTYPSLSLAHLAGALSSAGRTVRLVDCLVERRPLRAVGEAVEGGETVMGVTVNAANASAARRFARRVRSAFPELRIVAGGPHASSVPEVIANDWADAVLVGEGERAVVALDEGRPFEDIPGLVSRTRQGETRANPRAPFFTDLDSLPWPDWSAFPLRRYRFPGRNPTIPVITSRGCPFRCINCTKIVHGYAVRKRSVENVVDEIEAAVERWGVREYHLWDDHLTYDVPRVCRLCKEIIRRGLNRKARFALPNAIRADVYDEAMLDRLVRAGLYLSAIAVESGSQRVVDRLGKRLDLNAVPRMVDALLRRGVRVALYFMMGLPFETPEDVEATIRMACRLPAHHVHIFMATPFPGTPLCDLAEHGGFIRRSTDELDTYDARSAYMSSPSMSTRAFARKRAEAYRRFYLSAPRLARIAWALLREPWEWGRLARNAARIALRGARV